MKNKQRYVAKPFEGLWRVWNRKRKKWWGNQFKEYPQELLDELNGQKRQREIVKLCKKN